MSNCRVLEPCNGVLAVKGHGEHPKGPLAERDFAFLEAAVVECDVNLFRLLGEAATPDKKMQGPSCHSDSLYLEDVLGVVLRDENIFTTLSDQERDTIGGDCVIRKPNAVSASDTSRLWEDFGDWIQNGWM